MRAIADALVYAVSYINCRPLEEHESRYDDGDDAAVSRPCHSAISLLSIHVPD